MGAYENPLAGPLGVNDGLGDDIDWTNPRAKYPTTK